MSLRKGNTLISGTGRDGIDGQDGFSPSASVSKVGSISTLTVTDATGTTTTEILDGGQIIQYPEMPTAVAANVGEIIQYTGATSNDYINGYFYKSTANETPDAIITTTATRIPLDFALNNIQYSVEFDLKIIDIPVYYGWLMGHVNPNTYNSTLYYVQSGSSNCYWYIGIGGSQYTQTTTGPMSRGRVIIRYNKKIGSYYTFQFGNDQVINSSNGNNNANNLILFNQYSTENYAAHVELYSMKVYDNSTTTPTLIHNLIPKVDETSNLPALYDTITNTYYFDEKNGMTYRAGTTTYSWEHVNTQDDRYVKRGTWAWPTSTYVTDQSAMEDFEWILGEFFKTGLTPSYMHDNYVLNQVQYYTYSTGNDYKQYNLYFSCVTSNGDTIYTRSLRVYTHYSNNNIYPIGSNYPPRTDGSNTLSFMQTYERSNYLQKSNTTEFTPTGDYNPATKKYIDDNLAALTILNFDSGAYDYIYLDNNDRLLRVTAPELSSVSYVVDTGVFTITGINSNTFAAAVSSVPDDYVFTYAEGWTLDGNSVNLVDYGIAIDGTVSDNDAFTVTLSGEASYQVTLPTAGNSVSLTYTYGSAQSVTASTVYNLHIPYVNSWSSSSSYTSGNYLALKCAIRHDGAYVYQSESKPFPLVYTSNGSGGVNTYTFKGITDSIISIEPGDTFEIILTASNYNFNSMYLTSKGSDPLYIQQGGGGIYAGNVMDVIGGISKDQHTINMSIPDGNDFLAKDNTTAYIPSGDYNPATKKYIDDALQNIDLSNYIAKDNTTSFIPTGDYNPATKKYVDDVAAALNTLSFEVVAQLPTQDISTTTIYLVLDSGTTYDMWIYANSTWVTLGTTTVDLSNYLAMNNSASYAPTGDYNPATKKYVDDAAATKQNTLTAGTNITITGNTISSTTFQEPPEVITSSTSTYTIASLVGNKTYKLGEITDLTISAVTTFDVETVIYFNSGTTATSVYVPTTVSNIGDVPELTAGRGTCDANSKYIIAFMNNIAVWRVY